MKECGDATQYTATVSKNFTIPELIAIRQFMTEHDTTRLLKMAHQKYDQTKQDQWKHSPKWEQYCEVCSSSKSFTPQISVN